MNEYHHETRIWKLFDEPQIPYVRYISPRCPNQIAIRMDGKIHGKRYVGYAIIKPTLPGGLQDIEYGHVWGRNAEALIRKMLVRP